MREEINTLKDLVKTLQDKVNDQEERLRNVEFLKDEFTKDIVYKRDVVFKNPVYNAAGTKVIN